MKRLNRQIPPEEDMAFAPSLEICKKCPNRDIRAIHESFGIVLRTLFIVAEEIGLNGADHSQWLAVSNRLRGWARKAQLGRASVLEKKKRKRKEQSVEE